MQCCCCCWVLWPDFKFINRTLAQDHCTVGLVVALTGTSFSPPGSDWRSYSHSASHFLESKLNFRILFKLEIISLSSHLMFGQWATWVEWPRKARLWKPQVLMSAAWSGLAIKARGLWRSVMMRNWLSAARVLVAAKMCPTGQALAGRAYQDPLLARLGSSRRKLRQNHGADLSVQRRQPARAGATGGRGAAKVSLLPTLQYAFSEL